MGRATPFITVAVILALCYTAQLPIIILVVSVMLALVLDWPVEHLDRRGVPRQLSAAMVVVLAMGGWLIYRVFRFFEEQSAAELEQQRRDHEEQERDDDA